MATTIPQAEANLRAAALKYATLHTAYYRACEVERARPESKWEDGDTTLYSREWHTACDASNGAQSDLTTAAHALADAIAAEQRAEAL